MEKIPPIVRTEKTFVVAAAVLIVGAVVQLFFFGTTLLGQKQTPPTEVAPRPTPAPVTRSNPETVQASRVAALVKMAKELREAGDTATSLVRLREALALAPENPNAICEMALTYEKMGLSEKAAFQWERLESMGERTPYYGLAQARLRPIPVREEPTFGVPEGSILGFLDMTLLREPVANDEDNIILKIPIKARRGAKIDARDVVIQVAFYDLLPDAAVAQTSANVNYRWMNAPADWLDNGLEVLAAEYVQPKENQKSGRKYFGYAVSLYYKNILQDKKAEPSKLLEKFPAPLRLEPNGT